MKSTLNLLLTLLALAPTGSLLAGNFDFQAILSASSPTFNRPNDNGNNAPNSLSGEVKPYSVFTFRVTENANYSIRSVAPSNTWNNFLVLYAGNFNPGSPLTNAIRVNDNQSNGNYWQSRIDVNLVTGTTYRLVTTAVGFMPGGGPWTAANRIQAGGQANVIAISDVPEPSTLLLTGAGLAAALLSHHRRRRR